MPEGARVVAEGGGRHRVVVIGSGFGGLFATRGLRGAPVDLTLIGSTGHHLFQPLLYQVATGVLSQGEIAPATREVLRRQKNATVLLGEVTDIDVAGRAVVSRTPLGETGPPMTAWSWPPAPGSPTSATTTSPSSRRG